ncbi:MAG: 3-phosphoshikimate 1-carboxyvinyltransferase [Syntrophomonadaceae bacterium]|nr:3-phosphoshikimate 1-carboxyvinyltransferase [Syntrophomonadaceae bacterium]
MDVRIYPTALTGTIAAIASKSDAHRMLIAAALAEQPTIINMASHSDDIDATMQCLRALGAGLEQAEPQRWHVTPLWAGRGETAVLDCRDSAATLRLLLPLAPLLCRKAFFTGSAQLARRPLAQLCEQLTRHGAVSSRFVLPLTISGPLRGGGFVLPGNVSSQFVSGLLLALPLLDQGSALELSSPLESAGYVDMTLDTLRRFGVQAEAFSGGYRIPGGQRYHSPGTVTIEGDWSSGAGWLAAGALGRSVTVSGLDPASLQPDRAIAALLRACGAKVTESGSAVTVSGAPLQAFTADVSAMPDLAPILAVLGTAASGTTVITGAERLRFKESDRLRSMTAGLNALGARIKETGDGLIIAGGRPLRGGTADSGGDHRVAMALAIAALRCEQPVIIRGAEAVSKSYPTFWDHYRLLGGKLNEL